MIEAERFLEEKRNRGKAAAVPSSETTGNRTVPSEMGRVDTIQEKSRGGGVKYVAAAGASLLVWLLFCFGLAAVGLKGGYLVFALLFLVIIPGVWAGVLACFDKKPRK